MDETSEFTLSPVVLDIVETLREGGPSMRTICETLGIDFAPGTFTVSYAAFLCQQQRLPVAQTLAALHQEGVLARLTADLST